jgi:serine/threonine-protein kinase
VIVVAAAAAAFFFTRGGDETPSAVTPPTATTAEVERKMLVVLPFENLGPTEQEYFADGITEEITTRLAKLSDLGVISRTSAMQYKGSDKSLREIGDELAVDYALEGAVRWDRSGETDRVRINAQLIRTDDDTHLWAETYDRVYEQIFDLQTEIAEEVARALNITLIEPEMVALKERPTENLDAYDLYLKGREFWERSASMEQRKAATEMIEQAVELDSTFATAHAFLARVYANDHFNNLYSEMPRLDQALEAARAALKLAPEQPQGHVAMGYYHYYGSRDYQDALKEFAKAAERQPNNSDIFEAMGYVLRRQGHWDEAAEKLRRSVELDPTSGDKLVSLIDTLIRMRRYEEADHWIARALETLSDHAQIHVMRAVREFTAGDMDAAKSTLARARQRFGMDRLREFEAQIDLASRDYDQALADMGELGSWPHQDTLSYYSTKALIYDLKGDSAQARAYYDSTRAYAEGMIGAGEETHTLHAQLSQAHAFLGDHEDAVASINRAESMMPMSRDALAGTDVLLNRAITNLMLGNEAAAIDDLEHLLEVPSNVSAEWLRQHPGFDSLRDNPRFQALVQAHMSS